MRGDFDWETVTNLLRDVAAIGTNGWTCWSFSNHDVERAISRWNPARGTAPPDPAFGRLLMALLLSLRGSVSLYQGEELGLTEAMLDDDDLRDPFGIAYWPEFRGRDGGLEPRHQPTLERVDLRRCERAPEPPEPDRSVR